jgi:hypothetical protein
MHIYLSKPSSVIAWSVQGVGMPSLACWDRGFESREERVYLSLVNAACFQVEVPAAG